MTIIAEPLLNFTKRKLREHKGHWKLISTDSGVPYNTLTKIALGRVEDPRVNTVQKLADYFSPRKTERTLICTPEPNQEDG